MRWALSRILRTTVHLRGFHENAATAAASPKTLADRLNDPEFLADPQEYAALLQSVKDLSEGKSIHDHIVQNDLQKHLFLGNCIINMYVRCGSLDSARAMFETMQRRNVVSWTAVITANVQHGYSTEAFKLFQQMLLEADSVPNSYTFIALINCCADDLRRGRWVHSLISDRCNNDPVVANALINMYSKGCDCEAAADVFGLMQQKDIVSWTAIIGAYRFNDDDAVHIFRQMLIQGVPPNKVTFITVLGSSSSSQPVVHWIHSLAMEGGFDSDTVVANALVNHYGKSRSLEDASRVFQGIRSPDLVSWNAIISACIESGQHDQGVIFFRRMRLEGMSPNSVTFITVLAAFGSCVLDLAEAKDVHYRVRESGHGKDLVVMNALITLYAKSGSPASAWNVFKVVKKQGDLISWNAMLGAFADSSASSMKLFRQMLQEGVKPNKVSFVTLLSSCSEVGFGREVHHNLIVGSRHESEISVATTLINMYSKCGSLWEAESVFESLRLRNLVSWNAMLGAFSQQDCSGDACQLFHEMLLEGEAPDLLSFTTVLSSCFDADEGRFLQSCVSESGHRSARLETALTSMHGKCHDLELARKHFQTILDEADVVSWTTIIAVNAEQRDYKEAHNLFRKMQLQGVIPDKFTFATVLDCCVDPGSLPLGKLIHSCLAETGFQTDNAFENALVNMFVRCGCLSEACSLFSRMSYKDIVSWNAMIAAYAQKGLNAEAIQLFQQMQLQGFNPDRLSFSTTLNVCADLSEGRKIFALAIEAGVSSDVSVTTGLLKLLGRYGRIEEARTVFGGISCRWSVGLLNAVIAVLSQHGECEEAIRVFGRMQQEGVKPDAVTLLSVISACSHTGLIEEGCNCFSNMKEYYGISMTIEHYACLVDLVGRAGRLDFAEQLVLKMPFEESSLVWMSLLGTCKLQGDSARGKRAAERILKLDPQNSAAHVVLSNIYCSVGKWKD